MSTAANKDLVRRYYEELWNQWRLDLIDQLIASDFAFRGSIGLQVQGRDGFRDYVATIRAAFPDFHNVVEDLIAEGDQVAARLTYRGTHRGSLLGVAPTGRRISYAGMALFQVGQGRLTRGWVLGDTLGLMRQLGARPDHWPGG
jgi:steroid delta-isomerase-like uncharacterized protein